MADSYDIQMIPIDKINVINSRERSEKSYQAVKGNIENVGLKRPVTVRPSDDGDGYDLVCGEGRLRTFKELGQESIPAIIRHDLPKDDAYVMSLVENMARRQHTAMELMHGIELLLDSGYGVMDISRKTGLADSYVSGILCLLKNGEERLLSAVEKGQIPLSIAIKISSSPGQEQKALQDAYEKEGLRGNKFVFAQRLVERRRNIGKGLRRDNSGQNQETLSARQMVDKFKTEMDRMQMLIDKADKTNGALMIIIESFFNLLKDENFITLLRAEGLDTMPEALADMIKNREGRHA